MINLTKENAHSSAGNDFFRWNIDGIEIHIGTSSEKYILDIHAGRYTRWTFDSLQDDHIMGEDVEEVEFLPATLQPFFTDGFALVEAIEVDMGIFQVASIPVDFLQNDDDWGKWGE